MPDAISSMCWITVGSVFTPGLIDCSQVSFNLPPADLKERPNQVFFLLLRSNASESACACATQDAHQDGLCLIVQRVGRRDLFCFALTNQFCKPLVPQLARSRFQTDFLFTRISWNVSRSGVHLQCEFTRLVFYELLVSISFSAANLMMEMRHG